MNPGTDSAHHSSSPSPSPKPAPAAAVDGIAPPGPAVAQWHRLSWADFDELASAGGGHRAVSALRAAQASKQLLLLWALVTQVRGHDGAAPARFCVEECFAALVDLRRSCRDAVDGVLLHPPVGSWLHHCLRRLRADSAGDRQQDTRAGGDAAHPAPRRDLGGSAQPDRPRVGPDAAGHAGAGRSDRPIAEDIGHLGGVVAAMALRAGMAVDVPASVRDGTVMVPAYGLAVVTATGGWARIRTGRPGAALTVDTRQDHVEVRASELPATAPPATHTGDTDRHDTDPHDTGDTDTDPHDTGDTDPHDTGDIGHGAAEAPATRGEPRWRPLRVLSATTPSGGMTVILEDTDPFREPAVLVPAQRLAEAEVARWRALFVDAWHILSRDHPHRLAAIAATLRILVPITAPPGATSTSASSLDAFGSVLLSRPASGVDLLTALVHEVQHSKLTALDDVTPLLARRSPEIYYAPWRPDPRPLDGLLHGAYAFTALAGLWHERARREHGHGSLLAGLEFLWCRESVRLVVDTLDDSRALTTAGQRLTVGLRRQLGTWSDPAVPARVTALARLRLADEHLLWRLRNLVPDPGEIARWARAWRTDQAPPESGLPVTRVRVGPHQPGHGARTRLARRLIARTGRTGDANGPADHIADHLADRLLLQGRAEQAAVRYKATLRRSAGALEAWSGLALSRLGGDEATARGYARRPETVRTLWTALARGTGPAPDPDLLAAWIGAALPPDTGNDGPTDH